MRPVTFWQVGVGSPQIRQPLCALAPIKMETGKDELTVKSSAGWSLKSPTIVLGVLGILIAVFLYRLADKRTAIAVLNPESQQKVFDANASSPTIRVLDRSGDLIECDIYTAVLTLWNDGDTPIDKDMVRRPIQFSTQPTGRILEYSILEQSAPEVSRFLLTPVHSSDSMAFSTVQLDWDFFDPRHALRVQVVYTATDGQGLSVSGAVLNMDGFVDGRTTRIGRMAPVLESYTSWIYVFFVLVPGPVIMWSLLERYKDRLELPSRSGWWLFGLIVVGLVATLGVFTFALLFLLSSPPIPI